MSVPSLGSHASGFAVDMSLERHSSTTSSTVSWSQYGVTVHRGATTMAIILASSILAKAIGEVGPGDPVKSICPDDVGVVAAGIEAAADVECG